jgi:hypothetical protein
VAVRAVGLGPVGPRAGPAPRGPATRLHPGRGVGLVPRDGTGPVGQEPAAGVAEAIGIGRRSGTPREQGSGANRWKGARPFVSC